jgi:dTDP-glucose pyrophosphorylase
LKNPDKIDYRHLCVSRPITILEALQELESSGKGILVFTEEDGKVVGILTDPDIRRLLLSGIDLNSPAFPVINKDFKYVKEGEHDNNPWGFMQRYKIRQLPVLDAEGHLKKVLSLDHHELAGFDNTVVLMAGGLGQRLRPYTQSCPKPLLEVAGKPMLERIIDRFIAAGFSKFVISINYKGDMIRERIGDGSTWGCQIEYVEESVKLGTAGALGLLRQRPKSPLLISNGDVLTDVNPSSLLHFHERYEAFATMCVRQYEVQIPFGVVDVNQGEIQTIHEKPTKEFHVNAGIYCLESEALDHMGKDEVIQMPDFFLRLRELGKRICAFPIHEDWMDVGRKEDLDLAHEKYQ